MAFCFSDSEMHGIYLKSVKSPAIPSKLRIEHRPMHSINIFSQVSRVDFNLFYDRIWTYLSFSRFALDQMYSGLRLFPPTAYNV